MAATQTSQPTELKILPNGLRKACLPTPDRTSLSLSLRSLSTLLCWSTFRPSQGTCKPPALRNTFSNPRKQVSSQKHPLKSEKANGVGAGGAGVGAGGAGAGAGTIRKMDARDTGRQGLVTGFGVSEERKTGRTAVFAAALLGQEG